MKQNVIFNFVLKMKRALVVISVISAEKGPGSTWQFKVANALNYGNRHYMYPLYLKLTVFKNVYFQTDVVENWNMR